MYVFNFKKLLYFKIFKFSNSLLETVPPIYRQFSNMTRAKLEEKLPVLIKDPETGQVSGPFPLITCLCIHRCRTQVDPHKEYQAPSPAIAGVHIFTRRANEREE